MKFRQRDHEQPPGDGPGAADQPSGEGLSTLRRAGDDLLDAADRAIDKALSGDSKRFLRANRQQGGQ